MEGTLPNLSDPLVPGGLLDHPLKLDGEDASGTHPYAYSWLSTVL